MQSLVSFYKNNKKDEDGFKISISHSKIFELNLFFNNQFPLKLFIHTYSYFGFLSIYFNRQIQF